MWSDSTLGPLLQCQTRIGKHKSGYNSLIIGPRGLGCKPTCRKSWSGSLLMWSDLTFDPFKGQMRIAKIKSAYNLLIIGPRGLQCKKKHNVIMQWTWMWTGLTLVPSLFTYSHEGPY